MSTTKHFLVTDRRAGEHAGLFKTNPSYRAMLLTGATYEEQDLRKWIASVWGERSGVPHASVKGLSEKSPLPDLVRAAKNGGWIVMEVLA